MGTFLDKIAKRIQAAKGNSNFVGGQTLTGEQPNPVIINPDVIVKNESTDYFRRRKREEDIISGKAPARKKVPTRNDYAERRKREAGTPNKPFYNQGSAEVPVGEEVEHERHHTLFWGRANPPHAGHEEAYKKVKETMRKTGGTGSIVLSRSHDPKKNPLSPEEKEIHAKRAFPDVNTSVADKEHSNLLNQLSKLHDQGVTHLHMVAGSDRIPEYQKLIHKYNGVEGPHGYYNFKHVNLVSAGDRDPDAEGTAGISASSQRKHVQNNDFKSFSAGAPTSMKPKHVKELFNAVKAGMTPPPKKKLGDLAKVK